MKSPARAKRKHRRGKRKYFGFAHYGRAYNDKKRIQEELEGKIVNRKCG